MMDTPLGRQAAPRPLYILLHLYKTAGQTLATNIQLNLSGPLALQMYVGPMGLDISKAIGSPANPGWVTERVNTYAAENVGAHTRLVYGHMGHQLRKR